MSGARGSARKGKRKLTCTVERTDRSGRRFTSHLFVAAKDAFEKGEITERLRDKYDFPVVLVSAVWARPRATVSRPMGQRLALWGSPGIAKSWPR